MPISRSEDIYKNDNEEQYETGNSGERNYASSKKGGEDGAKLDAAMKRKYPEKKFRWKEYR